MTDATFTCKECGKSGPYYEIPKTLDPRVKGARVICQDCADRFEQPQAPSFNVERNFKKAGTSSQAAQAAAESARLNDTHRKIYRALMARPMTADEVSAELGLCLNTARARISDLKNAGHVEATGERRATDAGKAADVVRVVQTKREAA